MDMTVEHEDQGNRGRYVVRTPGAPEAEMTWHAAGRDTIVIDHTYVPPELRI